MHSTRRCSCLLRQGRPVALHLWDVAGSQLNAKPCHHSLIGQGAEGVLYVLDVTSRDSLQAVDEWDRALSKVGGGRRQLIVVALAFQPRYSLMRTVIPAISAKVSSRSPNQTSFPIF